MKHKERQALVNFLTFNKLYNTVEYTPDSHPTGPETFKTLNTQKDIMKNHSHILWITLPFTGLRAGY